MNDATKIKRIRRRLKRSFMLGIEKSNFKLSAWVSWPAALLLSSTICLPSSLSFHISSFTQPARMRSHSTHFPNKYTTDLNNSISSNSALGSRRKCMSLAAVRNFTVTSSTKIRLDSRTSHSVFADPVLESPFQAKTYSSRGNIKSIEGIGDRKKFNDFDFAGKELLFVPATNVKEEQEQKQKKEQEQEQKQKDEFINNKIKELLGDDDGEEDSSIPDSSEAAAKELADASYLRISDEATQKAYSAMEKNVHLSRGTERGLQSTSKNRKHSPGTKVTASVKETGVDTMSQYVKSIAQHELLTKESEFLLGEQIQILATFEVERKKLEDKMHSPPSYLQWSKAVGISVSDLKKQIRRSQRAKAGLTVANLRLVVTVARKTAKKWKQEINFEDACQDGIIGLTRACEKFDPQRGFRFSTFALWWIKGAVQKSINTQSRTVRLPSNAMKNINDIRINERLLSVSLNRRPTDDEIADKCGITLKQLSFYREAAVGVVSLDKKLVSKGGKGSNASGGGHSDKTIESLVEDSGPTPAEIFTNQMLKNDVKRLIRTLTPKEQAVIRLRFGLDDGTPRTLDYIGEKFSVSQQIVKKIESNALRKLRQPYRNQSVQCHVPEL